jgi:hypothetical protein
MMAVTSFMAVSFNDVEVRFVAVPPTPAGSPAELSSVD